MSITVNLYAHDLMGAPRPGVLVTAYYEIVAWNYQAAGGRESIDFSTAAGAGGGNVGAVTLQTLVNGTAVAAIALKYRFRRVDYWSPITLVNTAGNTSLKGDLIRTAATTAQLIVTQSTNAAAAFPEIPNATDLGAGNIFVPVTPSRARFFIVGQPTSDSVDTLMEAF